MKTNIPLELTDEQRNTLAQLLDGKETKRLATRKEVVTMAHEFFLGMLERSEVKAEVLDYDHLEDKNESYIRGWNLVGERMGR